MVLLTADGTLFVVSELALHSRLLAHFRFYVQLHVLEVSAGSLRYRLSRLEDKITNQVTDVLVEKKGVED